MYLPSGPAFVVCAGHAERHLVDGSLGPHAALVPAGDGHFGGLGAAHAQATGSLVD